MDNEQSSTEFNLPIKEANSRFSIEAQTVQSHSQLPPTTFSIATPTVTTILLMTENMSDSSFMLPATSYQQDGMIEKSSHEISDKSSQDKNNDHIIGIKTAKDEPEVESKPSQHLQSNDRREVELAAARQETVGPSTTISSQQPANSGQQSTAPQEDVSKSGKKRNKTNKKSTKLDAKSKLEKSRQSARECRARKKLRYQYLEDLVCNREKAVIKLREELSMFCELSKRIDDGTVNEVDRRLLVDQTKENSRNDSTGMSQS